MTVNEYFNQLNDKYNLYRFEITNYQERYEFYQLLTQVRHLDLPCCEISEDDYNKVVEIINR